MRRHVLVRWAVSLIALCAIAGMVPAVADAQPRPGAVQVVGVAKGVGYSIKVTGRDIAYTVTNVPRVNVLIPGACTTAVIDAVKAAPIVGTDIIALVQGQSVDVVKLLTELNDAKAVVATDLAKFADRNGTVTHTFKGLPDGLYAVMSVCNLNRNLYGLTGAFIMGEGLDYGSSA
ncbi:hypothetical protein QSJ19_13090 [Gordonia sp. ABSL11-1]|uniref:hypothetical protein n=1 Tax=Gordonia sp. ABSL11-1 TaxID=3053924 RepID=UPI00257225C2|nr:hypothetical protein [Gordonia sp. ABSL11-1]MDL9946512.1 hypothetical protein [Gordonia sp. ABSL11-1]